MGGGPAGSQRCRGPGPAHTLPGGCAASPQPLLLGHGVLGALARRRREETFEEGVGCYHPGPSPCSWLIMPTGGAAGKPDLRAG